MAKEKKKVLFVATVDSHIELFHLPYLKMFHDKGWEVHVATDTGKKIEYCDKKIKLPIKRSPFKLVSNYKAMRKLREVMKKEGYSIVHCHTPIAAACTRLACRKLRKTGVKVIYTAHGFHFYTGAPLKNWLLYYPVEWLCAHWTDVLITINKEDYERAKKHMHAKQVEFVPGVGIDVSKFAETKIDRVKKRREIDVPDDAILLVSVGELNENKNHSVVIKALAKNGNRNIHYAIAGKGDLAEYLTKLASSEGVQDQVHLLGFREDVNEIYAAADICVFPSIREGLGLAAVEGMACGLPLIVSDNRGTRGFLKSENAMTCRYDDVEAFAKAIQMLSKDKELRIKMGTLNQEKSRAFDYAIVNKQMKQIYGVK